MNHKLYMINDDLIIDPDDISSITVYKDYEDNLIGSNICLKCGRWIEIAMSPKELFEKLKEIKSTLQK